jgi:hypothetical protein
MRDRFKPQELESVVRLEPGEADPVSLREFALDAAIKIAAPGDDAQTILAAATAFLGFLEAVGQIGFPAREADSAEADA